MLLVILVVLFPLAAGIILAMCVIKRSTPQEQMSEFLEALNALLRDNEFYVR